MAGFSSSLFLLLFLPSQKSGADGIAPLEPGAWSLEPEEAQFPATGVSGMRMSSAVPSFLSGPKLMT